MKIVKCDICEAEVPAKDTGSWSTTGNIGAFTLYWVVRKDGGGDIDCCLRCALDILQKAVGEEKR